MRTGTLLALLILFAGCERQKSFDERYEDTAGSIENQTNTIDQELESSAAQDDLAGS